MEELLQDALDAALAEGAAYADVRINSPLRYEHLAVKNGEASALTSSIGSGIGVRARTDRAWGFATLAALTPTAARETARRATRVARAASRSTKEPLRLTEQKGPTGGRYKSAFRLDPFEVPTEQKIALLIDAERRLHVGPEVKTGLASFKAWDETKWFASSEGSSYRSRILHVGAGVETTAVSQGEVQRRSAPTSFGGDFCQAGWEFVESLQLPEAAARVGREAIALLRAPACPPSTTTLVLGSDQLALQVHESVGHALELDRILAMEAGYAGTSWVTPGSVGQLVYGSPKMHVVADATEPGGLGTFGWDDEGMPARSTPLVSSGRLVGVLTSRETASRLKLPESGATARAEGYHRSPLIRMTNIDLLAGDRPFSGLLEDVSEGLFVETNRSWSIDDKRLNFQFGCEIGRVIRKGELGEIVRNPIYAGMTPEFWRSMDAVGDRTTWHLWGVPNCGKGQPSQVARVGHGAPAARFRNVSVRGG